MYMLYNGVHAVYWCTHSILVYTLYTGVQAVYWRIGSILYNVYILLQAV